MRRKRTRRPPPRTQARPVPPDLPDSSDPPVRACEADWYHFPSWYDILHAPGTASEVNGLERIERRFRGAAAGRGAWLEPGCGSGRYLRLAAARGRRVIGLDLRPEMIDYARRCFARRGLQGGLFVADMTRFRTQRPIGFAFCLINTIRHLPSDRAMLDHFASIARALRPDGVYAVGIELSRYGAQFPSEDTWEGRRGVVRVQQVAQYQPPDRRGRMERVVSHLVVTTPGGEQHLTSAYGLRSYNQREWDGLVARSALREIGLCGPDAADCLLGPAGVVGGYAVRVLAPR